MSLVSFAKVQNDDINSLKQTILESLNLVDYSFHKETKNVVIKPNMCYYWDYSTGQTTDPKFVAALIDLIRERISPSIDISIVESDASAMKCKYAFRMLGYEKLAREKNIRLVNLSEDENEEIDIKVRKYNFKFSFPKTIRDAELRINVPKIKYMDFTSISCALKNIFGCNPTPSKYKFHPRLNETIVAINKLMKFDLHILDGIIVPGKSPRKLNLIMASQDPVAFDAAATRIAGVNPRTVKHIVLATREGLGSISYIPKGELLETFAKKYPKKTTTTKLLTLAYKIATRTRLINEAMIEKG